jgi:hypothetical protein
MMNGQDTGRMGKMLWMTGLVKPIFKILVSFGFLFLFFLFFLAVGSDRTAQKGRAVDSRSLNCGRRARLQRRGWQPSAQQHGG